MIEEHINDKDTNVISNGKRRISSDVNQMVLRQKQSRQSESTTDEMIKTIVGKEHHHAKTIFSEHAQAFSEAILGRISGQVDEVEKVKGGIHELLDQRNQQNAQAVSRRKTYPCTEPTDISQNQSRKMAKNINHLSSQESCTRKIDNLPSGGRNSSLCSMTTRSAPNMKIGEISVPEDKEGLGLETKKIDKHNSKSGETKTSLTLTSTTYGSSNSFYSTNRRTNANVANNTRRYKKIRSVPFYVALAVIFGGIILISGFFIHYQWQFVSKESQVKGFRVSEENIEKLAKSLHKELTEKIGLQATAMFSFPEQTFKRYVNTVRDGLYDPVRDRYKLVHDIIRADASTSYASIAFESGYYLASGHMTIKRSYSQRNNNTFEEYKEIENRMEWLDLYNQIILRCPDNATHVKIDDGNWTSYLNDNMSYPSGGKHGYVFAKNIHWTQALVEYDGSLPHETLIEDKIECKDDSGIVLNSIEERKRYYGWYQHVSNKNEAFIDAARDQGVGQKAFAYADLWVVDEPYGHFENQTIETYNFSESMWPDNNVDGSHTSVTFQNSSGMPNYGLTSSGIDNIMYRTPFDTRKRQWYQRGRALYSQNPVPPRGHAAYHDSVISWFPLYVWQGEKPALAVGLTAPLYGAKDEFAGVMTIDITIKTISHFLKNQTYGKTGVGFAVRPENYFHSHGGVGIDEYVNMTYNNHIGSLLGVSRGSDHGKVCGNDYTGSTEQDQYGPHYHLHDTEWFNSWTGEIWDYTKLEEMTLPISLYDKGEWKCRVKNNNTMSIDVTNRALPAANHEDPLIAKSAQHIQDNLGGFDGLIAKSSSGNTTYEYLDEKDHKKKEMLLHWTYLSSLEFPGFHPLIVVVVPKEDYLLEVLEAHNVAKENIEKTMETTTFMIITSIAMSTICSILVALVITMPLKRLNDEFKKLAKLDIDEEGIKDKPSLINEILSIQNSFRGMKMGLASFSKFVPIAVVKRIVGGDISATKLSVQRRQVTVMFADIAKFTSFVESWPLESVMLLLEEYLTAMVSVIEHNGGTIGDFIGDCIMAFWNSPLDHANHAQLAVDTAFAMEQRLATWNKIWEDRGLPEIRVRIGINTGEVLSGNIGSPVKMKFGVVGDTVNLASRVENLNKYYGSSILITDSTFDAVSYTTICRLIDKVAVKGRKNETLIYEPIASKYAVNATEMQQIADETTRMISLFVEKQFERVFELTEEHLLHHPDDKVVSGLREKARHYLKEPPGENWDGINRMSEK